MTRRRRLAITWSLWVAVILILGGKVGLGFAMYAAYRYFRHAEQVRPLRPVSVSVRRTTEPVRGEKLAYLVAQGRTLKLHAIARNQAYGPDETAECDLAPVTDHGPPPDLRCSCGFYAWRPGCCPGLSHLVNVSYLRRHPWWWFKNRVDIRRSIRAAAVLDVELMGRVVAYRRGYRAAVQRVLVAKVDQRCVMCARRAVGFCAATFTVGDGWATVVPTCGCQVPVRWSIGDLANMLGTEVAWDPDRKPPLTKRRRRA